MTTLNLNGDVGNVGQEGLERPAKPERLDSLEGLRGHEEPKGHEGPEGGEETARERKLVESRREREFYSYYESVLAYANTEPKFCDLHSLEAIAEHKAVPSADKTLTALVQLAALRIGTRRAMIFFFDEEYAYIIAESTRTLSLDDHSQHAPKDSLWLGFTKIPRGLSVCEATADLPANEGSNAQDRHSATLAHIVNDLTEDTRFCDRPYVRDGPKARFYAGVPITTPSGVNIGALCVLDDKPRNGLENGQIEFLRSMASTVMSHLELLRAKEENQRSRDMNAALAAFVEGKSKSEDWWHCNARSHDYETSVNSTAGPRGSRIRTPSERIPAASQGTDSHVEKSVDSAPGGYFAQHQPPPNPHISHDDRSQSAPLTSPGSTVPGNTVYTPTKDSTGPMSSPLAAGSPQGTDLPTRVRATASRASSLIQKGIGADGVLFLDATVGSVGGVIDSSQTLSQTESETDVSRGSDSSMKNTSSSMNHGPTNHHHEEDTTFAKKPLDFAPPDSVILGSAYSADIESRVQSAIEQAKISEKILKSLLRRYPNGQIWHFNAEGDASDEDDELLDEQLDDNLSATDAGGSTGSELEPDIKSPTSRRAGRRDRALKRDGRAIQSIFPGLRSLIFLGMWDPHQERWFGACIAVSYSSMRIFSPQHELSYLAAFCDVVLAEIWRLEAQEIGRSKNVFVSTISHELRSPLGMKSAGTVVCNFEKPANRICSMFPSHLPRKSLLCVVIEELPAERMLPAVFSFVLRIHGILGSAECLEEQQHSALSAELIRSITSCGNTLLDVVNDLLEYSRLNHDTRKRRNLQLTGQAGTTASEARSAYADTESGVNISTLTEDAVTAARLGFEQPSVRSQDLHGVESDHSATLILNIEDALSPDWMFSVASGSWKRICINLVTNALKYTPSGYINVTLHKTMLKRKPNKPQTALIELIVEDSGIGMSEEFQAKDLFRPFRQENNLTPGTGLGLNLVGQTVKSLGGTVHVRSNKGRGTTVKVSLPLKSLAPAPSVNSSEVSQEHSPSPPESVGFFGFGTPEAHPTTGSSKAKASRRLLNSMKRYCTQLGVPVYATDDDTNNSASIHILSEHALENSSQVHDGDSRRSLLAANNLWKPIIVICATRESASRLRSGPLGRELPGTTQYLWLPIGPAKLAAALAVRPGGPAENGSNSVAESTKTDSVATEEEDTEGKGKGEEAGLARTLKPTDVVSPMRDKGKGVVDITDTTTSPMNGEKSRSPLLPQPPQARKNGSESEADEPIHSPLPTRERVDRRSSTSASVSTENSMSLLLVDDNAINLRLLEVFAKKAGHVYRTAKNGQEAVRVYEQSVEQQRQLQQQQQQQQPATTDDSSSNPSNPHAPSSPQPTPSPPASPQKPKPEVILLDLNMPLMDGFEAARAIRRFEHSSGCDRATIVAVTGLGDIAAQDRAFASGMDLFLTKPVKMKEVRDVLEGVREGKGEGV